MHAASCTLVVHDVEFLVEEGVEADLSVFEALVQVLEHLLVHVVHRVLPLLAQLEKITEFFLGFGLRVEIHLQLLLQVLPSLAILGLLAHLHVEGLVRA